MCVYLFLIEEEVHEGTRKYRGPTQVKCSPVLDCPMIESPVFLIRMCKCCQQSSSWSLLTPEKPQNINGIL